MQRCFVYERMVDGQNRLCVTLLMDNSQEAQDWVMKHIPGVRIMDMASLPPRFFRDAWRLVDGKITVDLEAAKELKRRELRKLRKAAFAQLDIAYMRADEAGDTEQKVKIGLRKLKLRNLPQEPLPDDIEALATYIPDALVDELCGFP